MMQEAEVLKTIPELVCSYFSEEQFTLSYIIEAVELITQKVLYCQRIRVSLVEIRQ